MRLLKKIIVKLNLTRVPVILFYLFRIFPIDKRKIVFVNFTGNGFGDSPKYIAQKLKNEDLKLIWLVKDKNDNSIPQYIKRIKIFSIRACYELVTAKVWINNSRFEHCVAKRKNQVYIQTWHGGLALKKIEYDAEDKLSEYYKKVMKNDNKIIDYLISNSTFCTKMYRNGFKYDGCIKEFGTPRNDCLITDKEKLKQKVKKAFSINDNTKILLYAPTFRKDYKKNPYDINFSEIKKELEKKTGYDWIIIVKLHPRITDSSKFLDKNSIIDATQYSDIQELICASDLLITDYSSTMFEAMIADKPVIIYANDIKDYYEERGWYFDFDKLPFPLTQNNKELISLIKKYKINKIKENYEDFIKSVGLLEKGKASEKVCDLIKQVLVGGKDEQI